MSNSITVTYIICSAVTTLGFIGGALYLFANGHTGAASFCLLFALLDSHYSIRSKK